MTARDDIRRLASWTKQLLDLSKRYPRAPASSSSAKTYERDFADHVDEDDLLYRGQELRLTHLALSIAIDTSPSRQFGAIQTILKLPFVKRNLTMDGYRPLKYVLYPAIIELDPSAQGPSLEKLLDIRGFRSEFKDFLRAPNRRQFPCDLLVYIDPSKQLETIERLIEHPDVQAAARKKPTYLDLMKAKFYSQLPHTDPRNIGSYKHHETYDRNSGSGIIDTEFIVNVASMGEAPRLLIGNYTTPELLRAWKTDLDNAQRNLEAERRKAWPIGNAEYAERRLNEIYGGQCETQRSIAIALDKALDRFAGDPQMAQTLMGTHKAIAAKSLEFV